MAIAKKKQELKKQEDNLPALNSMYEEDAGKGFEEADKDSFAIPFLKLHQKMSPQLDEGNAAYIEGAKAGRFCNTVTNKIYESVTVLPCHYSRSFLEWVPRNDGGGLVNVFDAAEGVKLMMTTTKDENNRDLLPEGNELQDTRSHYVLDRKSTRLNSSHRCNSYAVFCLKKRSQPLFGLNGRAV